MAKTKKRLDYNEAAKNILANIGGKENVSAIRHCVTRVRFTLKDEGKADDSAVKNLEGVISVVHGGEYMVVIGDAVFVIAIFSLNIFYKFCYHQTAVFRRGIA